MSQLGKPSYNATHGMTGTGAPPFDFEGMAMSVFPLRASIDALADFCDDYFNRMVPPEIAVFRPSVPYVMLSIVNYGRMGEAERPIGWVSQNEVNFSVLLDRYRKVGDELVYQDPATVTPFLFVDDESSQLTGREVFGWPKVQGRLVRGPWRWSHEGYRSLLILESRVFPELYAGKSQQNRTLVEVEQLPVPKVAALPIDPRSPYNPFVSVSGWATSLLGSWMEGLDFLAGSPLRGYRTGGTANPAERLLGALRGLRTAEGQPTIETLNLKQFRDAEDSRLACYQAITAARLTLTRLQAIGLTGDRHVLLGNPTGGVRVKIHRYAAQPIVETLGLEVHDEIRTADAPVAILQPLLPYWLEMDARYERGRTLCWRSRDSGWREGGPGHPPHSPVTVERAPPPSISQPDAAIDAAADREPEAAGDKSQPPEPALYNTTRAGALHAVDGPFEFEHVSFRVLPLLADPDTLQRFVDAYLQPDDAGADSLRETAGRFEVWGRHVYLYAIAFGPMASATEDVGWWAHRAVWLAVPVKWYDRDGRLLTVATVSPYVFADTDLATTIGRETDGFPTLLSEILSPPVAWLDLDRPGYAGQPLMQLATEMFGAGDLQAKGATRTLIEITTEDALPADDAAGWAQVRDTWGDRVRRELAGKVALKRAHRQEHDALLALALEVIANGAPINQIALKQFRDCEEPEQACYQALVRSRLSFDRIEDLRPIDELLHVRIHHFTTLPMAEVLGLVVKTTEFTGGSDSAPGGVIHTLQAERPFFFRASMRTGRATNVAVRVHDQTWTEEPRMGGDDADARSDAYYCRAEGPTDVGRELVRGIDCADDRNRVQLQVREWRRATPPRSRRRLSREAAARAIEAIPPQMTLGALLSREWQHQGSTRFDRRQEELADLVLDRRSLGPGGVPAFAPELSDGDWYRRRATFFHRRSQPESKAGRAELDRRLDDLGDQDVDLVDLEEGPCSRYQLALLADGLADGSRQGVRTLLTDEAREDAEVPADGLAVLQWLSRHPESLRTPLLLANGRTLPWDPQAGWSNLVPMLGLQLARRG
ncbi:MAG TPA: hypothetical protein VMV46_21355 [Thermoanaerobaculia bacterium]|nr:hypothetical protein [Thermoanaerobaculia bacterium]